MARRTRGTFEPIEPIEPPSSDANMILDELAGDDGLLNLVVVVSHDGLYAGETIRMPVSERVASLIIAGWFEISNE